MPSDIAAGLFEHTFSLSRCFRESPDYPPSNTFGNESLARIRTQLRFSVSKEVVHIFQYSIGHLVSFLPRKGMGSQFGAPEIGIESNCDRGS